MEKQWEDAHKLCKYILMYEPHNKTAKEFLPLIEYKLQSKISGEDESDSDESDDSDDSSDDDDDDDEDSDDEEDDDDDDDEDDEETSDEEQPNGRLVESPKSSNKAKKNHTQIDVLEFSLVKNGK